METGHMANKRRLYERLAALAEAGPDGIGAALADLYHRLRSGAAPTR
jgi:hypothetical protein